MIAPHWYNNAHSIIYITRGESRIQVVDHRGESVLDDQVREGQYIVVPQNYAIVKQAGNEGCEFIAFNSNDNAMINTLSGRTSAVWGLPVDVIANAYQISRDEARRLKFNREETLIFQDS
ncbi:13S globulin basic chain-like [Lycium ferocissimum]|uniref:13S globulin basic chain-like n=1 Tax=Lycium ferocissimum TaxID=112874 RepID=UPI0028167699|nr:13S globulin basic chain-like [Lycium ferocissimum]